MIQQSHLFICLENKKTNLKRYLHPNVHSSTTYNSQDMKATKMSIDRWKDKKICYMYTVEYCAVLHSHKE